MVGVLFQKNVKYPTILVFSLLYVIKCIILQTI